MSDSASAGGYVEFVVLWILCGIVAAVVGSNKGRSGCGWGVIGFLLGPIGIVLALVVSPNRDAQEEKAVRSGDKRKCPMCAELIREEAIKCRYCGADVLGYGKLSREELIRRARQGRLPDGGTPSRRKGSFPDEGDQG